MYLIAVKPILAICCSFVVCSHKPSNSNCRCCFKAKAFTCRQRNFFPSRYSRFNCPSAPRALCLMFIDFSILGYFSLSRLTDILTSCTLPSSTDSGWTPDELHKSICTPSGVQLKNTSTNNLFKIHLESMWTPPGIQVASR